MLIDFILYHICVLLDDNRKYFSYLKSHGTFCVGSQVPNSLELTVLNFVQHESGAFLAPKMQIQIRIYTWLSSGVIEMIRNAYMVGELGQFCYKLLHLVWYVAIKKVYHKRLLTPHTRGLVVPMSPFVIFFYKVPSL